MNEEQLKLFLDVIQLGSFQKVAEQNYVSQRAVSRQIQRLEKELKTQLFVRGKNKIELTAAGKFFEQRCRALLNMLDDTQHELHRFSYRGETQLTIGYFSPFDAIFVHELNAHLPQNANLFVSEESVEHLVSDVMMGNLDCALVIDNYGFNYDYQKMGLAELPVHHDRMVIGASDRFAETAATSLELIRKMPVAYYSNEDSSYLKQAFISSLRGIVKPLEVLRVASYEQLQMLVGTGQAISFYPQRLIAVLQEPTEHINYRQLKNAGNQSCEFKLIYHQDNHKPMLEEAIKIFRAFASKQTF